MQRKEKDNRPLRRLVVYSLKPGKISLAFRFHYADVRKRSMILVLAIFLYRIDGIIIVKANKNG